MLSPTVLFLNAVALFVVGVTLVLKAGVEHGIAVGKSGGLPPSAQARMLVPAVILFVLAFVTLATAVRQL